jgi:hypothetical protein
MLHKLFSKYDPFDVFGRGMYCVVTAASQAEEVRSFLDKQDALRTARTKEDGDFQQLLMDLEASKEKELRTRLEVRAVLLTKVEMWTRKLSAP